MITRSCWPTLLVLVCLAAAAIGDRAIAAAGSAAATSTASASGTGGKPAAGPAPVPAALTPLQAEVARLFDEIPWPDRLASLDALLAPHTVSEKVNAVMPFLDTEGMMPPPGLSVDGPLALYVLVKIGQPATDALAKALDDPKPTRRLAAVMTLYDMAWLATNQHQKPGAWLIPRLAELLATDPSDAVRVRAGYAISSYRQLPSVAVGHVAAALDDRNKDVRHVALDVLRYAGPDGWPATARLAKFLNQQDVSPDDWRLAVGALASFGPDAREAISALIDALDKEKQEWLGEVENAIERIGGLKPEHAEALIRAAPRTNSAAVAKALKELKPADPRAADGLIKALDHCTPLNGYVLGDAIAALAVPNAATLDALRARMESKQSETKVWAAYAYFRLTGDVRPDREVLNPVALEVSGDLQFYHRASAARAMAMMGRAAAPDADLLRKQIPVLKNPDALEWFSRALLETVGEFDVSIEPLVGELHISEVNPQHKQATSALRAIGPAAAEAAAPALEHMVQSQLSWDQETRCLGATTLANMGPSEATRETVESLKDALNQEEWPMAQRAEAEAIWQITHDAATTVPPLVELLRERTGEFVHVTEALKSMGPAAKEAVPTLRKIRNADSNPIFRQYAAEALAAIVPAQDQPPRAPGDAEFARWWEDLKSEDTHVACPAVWRFAEAGDAAVAFLKERTKGGIEELRKRLQSDVGKEFPTDLAKSEGCGGEIRRFYRARQAIALREFLAAPAPAPR